jgi:AcrR family transcriptional regulator
MRSQADPTWPPGTEVLEAMCARGYLRRTFLRLAPERRIAVLNAALEQAAERGPGQLNIKTVAAKAGVSVGSLYQYFGGRDVLARLVCALASHRLTTVLAVSTPALAELPLAQGMSAYLTYSIAWCRREPTMTRIFAAAAYHLALEEAEAGGASTNIDESIVRAIAGPVQQVVRTLVEAASRRGELRRGVDVENASRVLNVLMISVIDAALLPGLNLYYRLLDGRHGTKRVIEAAVTLACQGLVGGAVEQPKRSATPKKAMR